ncbi:class D sortase [Salisediminibacterium beveridgei]|uniref:Sortase A n=1 Tax=Salisediminibacterium beveridgei TaxID=632773 RepID=A0A1D7QYH3_9BACI|nr:class D sortase [Salisediminibacterium beveridgei]AOM84065.1 hypothetical protein BBEV_2728 [Salisediminibacterium beveridgei]
MNVKEGFVIKFIATLFLLTGIGLIGFFYVSYESATGGVFAIDESNERSPALRELDWERVETGDEIASLQIPALEKEYLTYWGTDDDALDQGVGMHDSQWTTTPDEKGHTLLSGHRDTVFRELGNLKEGDEMVLIYDGIKYTYVINDIWITSADDESVVVEKDSATLTLSTCYPFHLLGAAPDRYIIQAELIDETRIALKNNE